MFNLQVIFKHIPTSKKKGLVSVPKIDLKNNNLWGEKDFC